MSEASASSFFVSRNWQPLLWKIDKREESIMVLLSLIAVAILVAACFIVAFVLVGLTGAGAALIMCSDVIICVAVVVLIVKAIIKRRK